MITVLQNLEQARRKIELEFDENYWVDEIVQQYRVYLGENDEK
jgi:hypothetical protein